MNLKETTFKKIILALSIVIPLVVVILFEIKIDGYDTNFLPAIYASTNALTAVFLVLALIAIKNKNIKLHERLIKICIGLSVVFLVLYVARHITSSEVKFGDIDKDGILSDFEKGEVGAMRYLYYVLLITHIAFSVIVIPFVLYAFMRGILNQVEKHKKIVRFAFPIWLYVAVSGVIVYLMISPYYV